ncbi:MAG: mechanosensitive ion channel family protein [Phycisphaerales bacterium JB043]
MMHLTTWAQATVVSLLAQADSTDTQTPQDGAQDAAQDAQNTDGGGGGITLDSLQDALNPDNAARLFEQYGLPVAKALLLLFAAYIFAGWAKSVSRKAMERAKIDITLTKFLSTMVRWTILILAGIALLGMFGVETASFAAVIGGMALAIGLAFQGTLGNLASGVMLLIFRPFKVGDVVDVSGVKGKVDEIGLFATTIDTPDMRRFIVPNGAVFGSTIENVTYHPVRRVDVNVGASYDADIDGTRESLLRAARSVPNIDSSNEPVAYLLELGGSSVDWVVRVWSHNDNFWQVREDLVRAIKNQLDDARIGIPYPQMEVHMISADAGG